MTAIGPLVTLSPRDYDAVLFDLDGVLTRTASVHAAAWQRLFDAFLEQRAADTGEAFVPFDIDADYRRYVDGAISEPGLAARKAMVRAGRFDAVMAEHVVAWTYLRRHFDVHLQPAGPAFKLNVSMRRRRHGPRRVP